MAPSRISKVDFLTRQQLPDLIRAWALIGIVAINVGAFAWPLEQSYSTAAITTLDKTVLWLTTALFQTKAYALFSMMFGVGLAFQVISAKQHGKSPAKRHFRRMFGLFALGFVHFVFFFVGDILTVYAVIGCLLYAFRTAKPKTLITVGLSLLAAQVALFFLFSGLMYFAESIEPAPGQPDFNEETQRSIALATAIFSSGSFMEAANYRLAQSPFYIIGGIFSQGASILGYFLLGLALAKKGLINTPEAPFWRKCRHYAFPIGLIGSLCTAYIYVDAPDLMTARSILCISFLTLFAPFLAIGYAGWIAKYATAANTQLKTFLARAGTATLSAYLLQSILLSYIFSAYGLGLFAKLGPAKAIAIGLTIGLITLIGVSLWRKILARGPFEMALRSWTYLGGR